MKEESIIVVPHEMVNLHTKIMLVEADFGKGVEYRVYTGSPNFTGHGIYWNLETQLIFNDIKTYDIYYTFFNRIHSRINEFMQNI